jgi:hypothetical protein
MVCHRVEASHWQDVPPEKEDLKDRKNSFVNRHVALSRPCELWLGTPSNTTISTMGMLLNADGHRHNSFALHPRRSHRRYSEQPLQRTRKNLSHPPLPGDFRRHAWNSWEFDSKLVVLIPYLGFHPICCAN